MTYVDIMEHHLPGLAWTIGKVGVVQGPTHTKDFATDDGHEVPPIRKGWHNVSVENPKAKGGYALAALPKEHLAPHHCTSRCPKHVC